MPYVRAIRPSPKPRLSRSGTQTEGTMPSRQIPMRTRRSISSPPTTIPTSQSPTPTLAARLETEVSQSGFMLRFLLGNQAPFDLEIHAGAEKLMGWLPNAVTADSWAFTYRMVELVTVIGVVASMEICGYTGYHEPPMLLVITELSIAILPVRSLLTKKMALP